MKQFKVIEIDDLKKGEMEVSIVKANTIGEVVETLNEKLTIKPDSLKEVKKRVYTCEYVNAATHILIVECKFI